ncbi:hypothetical protein [Sphingobacterium mizutaii]|nr:hypothetical protein [Sphingobacterium mizutaii]
MARNTVLTNMSSYEGRISEQCKPSLYWRTVPVPSVQDDKIVE